MTSNLILKDYFYNAKYLKSSFHNPSNTSKNLQAFQSWLSTPSCNHPYEYNGWSSRIYGKKRKACEIEHWEFKTKSLLIISFLAEKKWNSRELASLVKPTHKLCGSVEDIKGVSSRHPTCKLIPITDFITLGYNLCRFKHSICKHCIQIERH